MAVATTFNGKRVTLPGVYTRVKSGIQNPPIEQPFGNIVIIDKDDSNVFGYGSGVAGEFTQGQNSLYSTGDLQDFRNLIRGGELWDNAIGLFRPAGPAFAGVSQVSYIRALTTTAPSLPVTFDSGSTLTLKSKIEGYAGEGVQGDETLATIAFEVTTAGAAGDIVTLSVDFGAGAIAVASYTVVAGDNVADVAQGILDDLNANFSANRLTGSRNLNIITISAPSNSGATANAYASTVTNTGTVVSAVPATFAGGVDGAKLTRGLAMTISSGTVDTAKYVLSFHRGTFTGLAPDGLPYNEVAEADTNAELITQTPEISTLLEFQEWAVSDLGFGTLMDLSAINIVGVGAFTATDLVNLVGNQMFAGGTQAYDTARVTEALDAIAELNYSFIYSLDSGANAYSADNAKILDHFFNGARFQKAMVVAGGNDANTFQSQSVANAALFDSNRVILVHGGVEVNSRITATGRRSKPASYKAAFVLGRIAGIEPQVPVTFKILDYAAETHILKGSEKEFALEAGVLTTGFDSDIGGFVVCAGINTFTGTKNDNLVNTDGTSHLISVERIAAELNKGLEINIKITLLGNQRQGPNRATLDDGTLKAFTKTYLASREAETDDDDLILGSGAIIVETRGVGKFIKYEFEPNFEVNQLFVTSIMVDNA